MTNTHYKVFGKALDLANAFGFLYPAELFLLQAVARTLPKEPVMVCIGVGTGTGSLGLTEIRPDAHVYSVDISEGGPFGGLQNERNAFADTGLPLPTQILGDSQKIHTEWPRISGNKQIDLLFIDGDHSETALQGDIDGWVKYVKPGGYVFYHDYGSEFWEAVQHVVDKNMNKREWQPVYGVDTIIAFKSRGQK